ncbi:MAG: CPBP family intramembrane metalloprotease [Clostridia bacterium]|nr:CPBP family intramembrane metalloprotease [Clostridia bacterium]
MAKNKSRQIKKQSNKATAKKQNVLHCSARTFPQGRYVSPMKFAAAYFFAALVYLFLFRSNLQYFWYSLASTAVMLAVLAFVWGGKAMAIKDFRIYDIIIGIGGGSLLYILSVGMAWVLEKIFPLYNTQIIELYSWKEGYSLTVLVLMIVFLVGPGLEVFWRGMMTKWLITAWNVKWGIILSVFAATFVYLPSLSLTLICAGLLLNIVCSALYAWRKTPVAPAVAHSVWLLAVAVFFPLI